MTPDDQEAYLSFAKLKFHFILLSGFSGLGAFIFSYLLVVLFSLLEPWRIALFVVFVMVFIYGCVDSAKNALYMNKLLKALLSGDRELYMKLLDEYI